MASYEAIALFGFISAYFFLVAVPLAVASAACSIRPSLDLFLDRLEHSSDT
jgi:hypothetical protein